jgi:predicted nucleic acid-binding Zn ribbon protein
VTVACRLERRSDTAPDARGNVQHAPADPRAPVTGTAPCAGRCVRCGARAATRHGARFCSARCRQAAVRERRAAQRADLLAALKRRAALLHRLAALHDELAEVDRQVEANLRGLGLNPVRPRRRKESPCPKKP